MFDKDEIKYRFPLHYCVWLDDKEGLKKQLKTQPKPNLEQKDPRGRTALMLAVTLGHKKCAQILLNHKASVNVTDSTGFNVLHEAVTTADPEFIRDVYEQKEVQRYSSRVDGIPNLLLKICDTTDFYLEMKWEFTSWVPLISRLCPSDTYKIYKSGSKVRVDTTLVGIDQTTGGIAGTPNWQRGQKSFIFLGCENGATFLEVDHIEKQIQKRTMKVITQEEILEILQPTEEQISDRLSSPISTTFIDTEKIIFERAKSGIIGFRSDRSEPVNGYDCKVYSANNVELVTKTRMEHLTTEDRERIKAMENSRLNSLKSWAGIIETIVPNPFENVEVEEKWKRNPWKLRMLDYFNPSRPENISEETLASGQVSAIVKDIGLPREMSIKTQHFKANLWLSEEFPLSLPEQILPIVDLMAISSSHFAKLRDFIAAKIPVGFPVKIEIPLFHLLNARITFGNIFATSEAVHGVMTVPEDSESDPPRYRCSVDESCFEPPADYVVIGGDGEEGLTDGGGNGVAGAGGGFDDEDQFAYSDAWEQYFNGAPGQQVANGESGTEQVTFMDALRTNQAEVDPQLQKAIQLSLLEYQKEQSGKQESANGSADGTAATGSSSVLQSASAVAQSILKTIHNHANGTVEEAATEEAGGKGKAATETNGTEGKATTTVKSSSRLSDEALQRTIEASRLEAEAEAKRRTEEEEMLKKVLELSMTEK